MMAPSVSGPAFPDCYLSLGQAEHREFSGLWRALRRRAGGKAWRTVLSCTEFLSQQRRQPSSFEFAVIWQHWSEEWSVTEIAELLAVLPLCRVVCITGPWSEADQRTRRVWPPGLVVPWWRAPLRLERELTSLQEGLADAPPWTASREEFWLWEQSGPMHIDFSADRVRVQIHDRQYAAMLAETITAFGGVLMSSSAGPDDTVVIEADAGSGECQAAGDVEVEVSRVLAVSAWPTIETIQRNRPAELTDWLVGDSGLRLKYLDSRDETQVRVSEPLH